MKRSVSRMKLIVPALAGLSLAACETTRSLQWGLWHFDGQPGRGTSEAITYRLWAEVTMLRDATWAVGTFTSNVGRLVQVLRTQPEETFASVDAAWYPGSWYDLCRACTQ